MEFFGLAAGFVLGFVASWLFWRSQLMIQPNIEVSNRIAVRQSKRQIGVPFVQVKIVNLSSRPVIDMTATLGVHEINKDNRGPTRKLIHSVQLNPATPTFIGPKTRIYDPWSITNVHYYTSEPDNQILYLLDGERKLVLTILAKDATSGTTIVKRLLYSKSDLIHGHFRDKRSMEIVAPNEEIAQQSPPADAPKARAAEA